MNRVYSFGMLLMCIALVAAATAVALNAKPPLSNWAAASAFAGLVGGGLSFGAAFPRHNRHHHEEVLRRRYREDFRRRMGDE